MFDLTLSFDNGPDPEATPLVLDVLARRSIKATFFVIGKNIIAHRPLAERAAAEGHWVGNHTFTHSGPLGRRSEPGVAEDEVGRKIGIADDARDLLGLGTHGSDFDGFFFGRCCDGRTGRFALGAAFGEITEKIAGIGGGDCGLVDRLGLGD